MSGLYIVKDDYSLEKIAGNSGVDSVIESELRNKITKIETRLDNMGSITGVSNVVVSTTPPSDTSKIWINPED